MLGYLDANSGSIIVAALAGGAAGIAVLCKLYWNRILGLFSRKHRTKADEVKAELVGDEEPEHEETPA
jgi:hypothetical protein